MKEKYKNRIVGSGTMNPADIKMNPLNWRKHPKEQSKALDDALSRLGWIQDVIVNKTTGHLIDGHLRVETALKNKEAEVPVKYVELTEEEEKIALATFDPLTMMAEQDDAMLKKLLEDCGTDVDMSQYHEDYDKLMRVEHTEEELESVPDVPKVAKTKRGDVYKLGEHVLMCGDSTSEDDVKRLISMRGGEFPIDMIFTDPPYNMNYCGEGFIKHNTLNIKERIKDIIDFDPKTIGYITKGEISPSVFIFTSKDLIPEYLSMFRGWLFNIITWHKINVAPMVNNNYLPDTEYCMYFHKGKRVWNNHLTPITIYRKYFVSNSREGRKGVGDLHPTMKPVEFIINQIKICSKEGGIVLDIFGGSGSTLVACEETGRKCRMMELSPEYCDVIVERWEKLTGKHAELIREGGKDAN